MRKQIILLLALLFSTISCYKAETGEEISLDGLFFENIENGVILKCSFNPLYLNEIQNQGLTASIIGIGPYFHPNRNNINNQSMSFRTNSYLKIEDNNKLHSNTLSINFWIENNASISSSNRFIISKGDFYDEGSFFITSNKLYLGKGSGYFEGLDFNNFISNLLNQWVMITVIIEQNVLKIYLNGNLEVTKTLNYNFEINNGNKSLNIGTGFINNTITSTFTGTIDDLTIYNSALSDQEIQNLYNN